MQRFPVPAPVVAAQGAQSAAPLAGTHPGGPSLQNVPAPAVAPLRPPLPPPPSDPGLELVLSAIQDIKNNIAGLLAHIETQADYLSWPVIMDRFSLISSQMANLAKTMKTERIPDFRKVAVVPFLVSQEPDPAVEKMTEGRIMTVNHENVPSYLRTKLDPEVEGRFDHAYSKMPQPANLDGVSKADKQIQNLNKICTALGEHLDTARTEWDSKATRGALAATYSPNDTNAILMAITTGKGLPASVQFAGSRPHGGAAPSNTGPGGNRPSLSG